MSHPINEQIKEDIMDEVMSMTIEKFQNVIDERKIAGNTVVDEMVDNLIQSMFEERGI